MSNQDKQFTLLVKQILDRHRLSKIIDKSFLAKKDKEIWLKFLPRLSQEQVLALLKILKEKPDYLNYINQNLQKKIDILRQSNWEDWRKLFGEERNKILSV